MRGSFFERLTGAVRLDEESEATDLAKKSVAKIPALEDDSEEAQLTIDVYQTPTEIIVKTMVPGVKPDDLDVLITREQVTIRGKRMEERTVSDEDYYHRELYWGAFSRMITLPEEVDVDGAEAVERHGMLILHLPKLDKNRQTKLRVKGN